MKDVEERIAARKARDAELRESLATAGFDGPYKIQQGEPFGIGGIFGGGDVRYCICLTCAAMIRLDDPEEKSDGTAIERSLRIHLDWHTP